MELVDLLVTPFYLIVVLVIAYGYRLKNRKDFLISQYFLSAYFLRIVGGMAFAFVYAFYYGGGDTINYHHDSIIISNALRNNPTEGLELLLTKPDPRNASTYKYVSKMIFRSDEASHFVSAVAAVFDFFTFNSFLSTTLLFSLIGFYGNWRLFKTLCRLFPDIHKYLAIGCLYLPSILFWSSGLMKDTLCTAALCFLFSSIVNVFVFKNRNTSQYIIIILTTWILYILKIYILLCFIPTVSIFIFSTINNNINNTLLRKIFKPFLYTIALLLGYLAIDLISEDNTKYSFDTIEKTAQITAQYIGAVSIKTGGSFYSLGELDFSPSNIPFLMLKSFNVTFYRPYFWEVTSPMMFFSVLEGFYFIYLSFLFLSYTLRTRRKKIFTPFTTFCFSFAICFAFVVGTTSNNFGTLARYKALMLPFFVCGIYATIKQKNIAEISPKTI